MNAEHELRAALAERYEIDREIGAGGMATVYLARDRRHDRDVALKVLREELSQSLGRERFLREIKLAARLNHPHILPLHDSGEAAGLLYFVMPAIHGQTLRDRLAAERQLVVEDAVRIALEVADALDYAHRHDVVHRDIKPENILLHEGHAMVADFGIGKAVVAAANESGTLTQFGMTVGTPAYMSPEQASGDPVDGRSDLFSLGCVFYEMLTGDPPFTGPTAQAIIARRFMHVPSAVTDVRAGVPTAVSDTVARLLEQAPDDRHATGALVVSALRSSGTPAAPRAKKEKSVAVLPFTNMSADAENEYFSDGVTEELINALTQVPGLKVAARASAFSFKGRNEELSVIGRKLGVELVVQGSVRRAGNRVRVTAQLMNAKDGFQLWSDRFDRELDDIFAIQDDIARSIVQRLELALHLGQRTMVEKPTDDLEAYQLFLRGREQVRMRTAAGFRLGIELHSKALANDPAYAQAHAGMAEAYIGLGVLQYMPPGEANVFAQRELAEANRLQPNLPFALLFEAQRMLYLGDDLRAAGIAVARVCRTLPNEALAHAYAAQYYATVENHPARRAAARRALELDPLSAFAHALAATSSNIFAAAPAEALEWARAGLALDPNSVINLWTASRAHQLLGEVDAAVQLMARAVDLSQRSPMHIGVLGSMLAAAVRHEEVRQLRRELDQQSEHSYVGPIGYLTIDIALGDEDAIMASLDRCLVAKTGPLTYAVAAGHELRQWLDHPRLGPLVRRTALFATSSPS